MSVIIGSARIDENGKAKGGKAGDQTGKEVSTQKWYKHTKVWRVFRAKDDGPACTPVFHPSLLQRYYLPKPLSKKMARR